MFKNLDASVKTLLKTVINLVYFMRGSIQYDDMMWRTPFERDLIEEFVEQRLDVEKDKQFPIY